MSFPLDVSVAAGGVRQWRLTNTAALLVVSLVGWIACGGVTDAHAVTTERVGAYSVKWPSAASLHELGPGSTVRVMLARSTKRVGTRARVSLVRVARSGRPLKLVAERRVYRRAVFRARLPATDDARYTLRIVSGQDRLSRRFTVRAPSSSTPPQGAPATDQRSVLVCDHGQPVPGALSATPAEASPGQVVVVTLANTGSACLAANDVVLWQIYQNGAWFDIPLYGWTAALRIVQPRSSFSAEFPIPRDAAPGKYRVGKRIDAGGPRTDVFAEVRVIE